MAYRIAGIDVHKAMVAVVIADVEVEGDWALRPPSLWDDAEPSPTATTKAPASTTVAGRRAATVGCVACSIKPPTLR